MNSKPEPQPEIVNMFRRLLVLVATTLVLTGCDEPAEESAAAVAENAAEEAEARPQEGTEAAVATTVPADATLVSLHVEGLFCSGCADGVKDLLEDIDGVYTAEVDFSTGSANVQCDPDRVRPEQLTAAFDGAEIDGTPMDWVATIVSEEEQQDTL